MGHQESGPTKPTRAWPTNDNSRIPYWIYGDRDLYQKELDRIFYGPFWTFVGLECEIPNQGDYKRAWIGERSVLVTRATDASVNVLLNSCAHRGTPLCARNSGHMKEIMCPYHQWVYDHKGNLLGVPFRRGVKGKGGYPADFDPQQHNLRKLKVEVVNGVIFASFDHEVLPLKEYLGNEFWERLLRVLDGRKLKLLGYQRQRIKANWKTYQENMKDAYHASLLHVFLVSFGLYRIDQEGEIKADARTRSHNLVSSIANDVDDVAGTEEIRSLRQKYLLNDMRPVSVVKEYNDRITIQNLCIFPAVTLQQQQNSLQFRNIIPKGPEEFEVAWTYFGYEDDTEEMTERRLRLANLTGISGFISVDDSEVLEMSSAGTIPNPDRAAFVELGGRDAESPEKGNQVSEAPMRGFYEFYRSILRL